MLQSLLRRKHAGCMYVTINASWAYLLAMHPHDTPMSPGQWTDLQSAPHLNINMSVRAVISRGLCCRIRALCQRYESWQGSPWRMQVAAKLALACFRPASSGISERIEAGLNASSDCQPKGWTACRWVIVCWRHLSRANDQT